MASSCDSCLQIYLLIYGDFTVKLSKSEITFCRGKKANKNCVDTMLKCIHCQFRWMYKYMLFCHSFKRQITTVETSISNLNLNKQKSEKRCKKVIQERALQTPQRIRVRVRLRRRTSQNYPEEEVGFSLFISG